MTANQYPDMAKKNTRRSLTQAELEAKENLRKAWNERKKELGLTQESAADKMGMTQGAVSHYLNGIIPLNLDAILKFSDLIDIDPKKISDSIVPDYFAIGAKGSGIAIEFGQQVRDIKNGTDPAPYGLGDNMRQETEPTRSVPVLTTREILEGKAEEEKRDRAYAPSQESSSTSFAYAVSEIPNPNDRFGIDTDFYIIIDPEAVWQNGKKLLVKDNNDNLLIRRYEIVGRKRYLAPYNEKYDPIELDDQFTVIGRIVGRYAPD